MLDPTSPLLRLGYTSFVTPATVYDVDLPSRELLLRKRTPVLGGFRRADYEQHREWAAAADGTRVPMSVVCRVGTPRDGTAPVLLYGYGSYEHSIDPAFTVPRLSLLDRGVVFAVAHVRGGGELGRHWYEQGRIEHKTNTFTDFVACAERLVESGLGCTRNGSPRWAAAPAVCWWAPLRTWPRSGSPASSPRCRSSTRSRRSSTRRCR